MCSKKPCPCVPAHDYSRIVYTPRTVCGPLLFCSLAVLDPEVGHTMDVLYFLHVSRSSVILTDSSTESPVHLLMLSIQAVRGLPRLRAPGIISCIISFSRLLLVSSWFDHSMLASLLWRCLTVPSTPALLSMKPAQSFLVHSSHCLLAAWSSG